MGRHNPHKTTVKFLHVQWGVGNQHILFHTKINARSSKTSTASSVADPSKFIHKVGRFAYLLDDGGNNVDHRVVGRLARGGAALGGVADDAEGGLVDLDGDLGDGVRGGHERRVLLEGYK